MGCAVLRPVRNDRATLQPNPKRVYVRQSSKGKTVQASRMKVISEAPAECETSSMIVD